MYYKIYECYLLQNIKIHGEFFSGGSLLITKVNVLIVDIVICTWFFLS